MKKRKYQVKRNNNRSEDNRKFPVLTRNDFGFLITSNNLNPAISAIEFLNLLRSINFQTTTNEINSTNEKLEENSSDDFDKLLKNELDELRNDSETNKYKMELENGTLIQMKQLKENKNYIFAVIQSNETMDLKERHKILRELCDRIFRKNSTIQLGRSLATCRPVVAISYVTMEMIEENFKSHFPIFLWTSEKLRELLNKQKEYENIQFSPFGNGLSFSKKELIKNVTRLCDEEGRNNQLHLQLHSDNNNMHDYDGGSSHRLS
ncbi:hypothetical protein SNEBB_008104 [Seison nebaliae]|nr:hypothetical protein SNEBB_008104 [Seison nebaliae]